MSKTLPESIFNAAKSATLGAWRSELQDPTAYLGIMRGLSIKAPASWGVDANLKAQDQVDYIKSLNELKYADVKDLFANAMQEANRADGRVIITTVANDDKLCTYRF